MSAPRLRSVSAEKVEQVFHLLDLNATPDGAVRISAAEVGARLGFSQFTAHAAMMRLLDDGRLERVERGSSKGSSSLYQVHYPAPAEEVAA